MDLLQLVFGFVNAPLFATFLLGMFWKRTTGHGAFLGLLARNPARPLTHGLTRCRRQRRLAGHRVTEFPSTMAQNFWIAIFAWTTCFRRDDPGQPRHSVRKPDSELRNLVYGLTEIPTNTGVLWYKRPGPLAIVVAVLVIALNSCSGNDYMDLRVPSGWFFLLLGAILIVMGVALAAAQHRSRR